MLNNWTNRSLISANLLNPAFCGEILRRASYGYYKKSGYYLPYSLSFIILPMLLHKTTREILPRSSASYFHTWVNENEYLLIDFPKRCKNLTPYTKESIMFLMLHKSISIENGQLVLNNYRRKTVGGQDAEEVAAIYDRAEFLGKWLSVTGNEQTIYMFLKIRP